MKAKLKYAFAALLALGPIAAQAELMAIDFTVASLDGKTTTGSGTAFTDSSNVVDSAFTTNLADLTAMTMSLSGIPSAPATTSFTKADLTGWFLEVIQGFDDPSLNFFGTNADGYRIEGFTGNVFALCQGPVASVFCARTFLGHSPAEIDELGITVRDIHAAIPEPATIAFLGLGLAGLGFLRRKQ